MTAPFRLKAPEPTEFDHQTSLVDALHKYATPRTLWFAVPNQSGEGPARGAHLKRMGRRAGVSDLVFIRHGQVLFLELKDHKGDQSESQIEFQRAAEIAGASYELTRSLTDSLALLYARGFLTRDLTGSAA